MISSFFLHLFLQKEKTKARINIIYNQIPNYFMLYDMRKIPINCKLFKNICTFFLIFQQFIHGIHIWYMLLIANHCKVIQLYCFLWQSLNIVMPTIFSILNFYVRTLEYDRCYLLLVHLIPLELRQPEKQKVYCRRIDQDQDLY